MCSTVLGVKGYILDILHYLESNPRKQITYLMQALCIAESHQDCVLESVAANNLMLMADQRSLFLGIRETVVSRALNPNAQHSLVLYGTFTCLDMWIG